MGLFDFKKLKDRVQETVDTVSTAVKDGTIKDAVDGAVNAVMDGTATEAVTAAVKDSGIVDRVSGIVEAATGSPQESADSPTGIAPRDALQIFYYLMAADGKLADEEIERFNNICTELVSDWSESERAALVNECQAKLDASASSLSPLIPIITCVDKVLYEPSYLADDETPVPPKLLLWDLLAIAHGDGNCDDAERELINHITQIIGENEATILEMEGFAKTLLDIEREEAWIKTTNQPYLAIEAVVNDLASRKSAVIEGIQDLINL